MIKSTHPLAEVDIGLKSVRPDETKCWRTSDQSSRGSQLILLGGSTSTGITWLTAPHWMRTTAQPMPPLRRHRSSRRSMSAATSGSRDVIYERCTRWVPATENLEIVNKLRNNCEENKLLTDRRIARCI